ncbi:MAG: beta-propeller fold lactonase family protein [Terriglobales bacterium]
MRILMMSIWTLALLFVTLSISEGKTNYAYVANINDNTVSVVNTSNNSVLTTVPVGDGPWGVAVNQAGSFVYVANNHDSANGDSVSVISTSTNTVVATIKVGTVPFGVALTPNGKTAYVANANSNSVSVINTGTKTVIKTIPVQTYPVGLAVTPNGTFVYVANDHAGTVSVISTLTNTVVNTIPVGTGPIDVAISPDGTTAYVTNGGSNTVSLIQTANNLVVKTINVSAGPLGAEVSPDGHWLYVASSSANVVTVIDTASQTVTTTIAVGSGPLHVGFTEDSAFAYISNFGSNNVSVINTATRAVVNTIAVGNAPIGVGLMGKVKVSTVAGGYVGDKGLATSAALGAPYSSILDSAGNLYISDIFLNRIRKVDATGTITTYAGNGICGFNGDNISATKALVCATNGLALDSSGNLIVADGGNSRIRKIDHSTHKITTIAGNGVFGYSGDGGSALNAEIGQPFQITYDAAGNLYFDQVGNCVVRKVDTSGIIMTVAGNGICGYTGDGGPATSAELNLPRGVALDASGNLYVGDTDNCVVRKVNTGGTITTFAGNGSCGFSGDGGPAKSAAIGRPTTLTVRSNVLYISNAGRQRVRSVDLSTNIINTYAGSFYGYDGDGHSLAATEFVGPKFSLFDSSGNPIFNDAFNGRVRKATGGIVSTIAGGFINDGQKATSAAFELAEALAIDKSGNLYIADQTGNRVRKVSGGIINTIAGNGISGYSGDGGPGNSPNTELNEPQGVAVDSTGNVFIADTFNGVVRKVDTTGTITTFAANSNFNDLLQMATDGSNNVYVADDGACVIWKMTPGGVVSIAAGVLNTCGYNGDGISATAAQLNASRSVSFDSNGNMLIADFGNNRVREVNTSGVISTIAGNGTCGYTGDGGSATAAELCPYSVAVDKSGNAYVADINFLRIRKIKGGTITTFAGAGFGFNGDKLWPLYTTFDDPVAVAVDSKGAVYELDDWDHRVRKIQ